MTPKPERVTRILVGAQSPASIGRAARMADGVITLSNQHFQMYFDALAEHGKPVEEGRIYASQWVVVAEDPEKLWADGLGERVLFQLNEYITWGVFDSPATRGRRVSRTRRPCWTPASIASWTRRWPSTN